MDLRQALRAERNSIISFVGAGGKTTAIFQLARQMESPVFITTTTHLTHDQAQLADRHIILPESRINLRNLDLPEAGLTLVTGVLDENGKWKGLPLEDAISLGEFAIERSIPLLVEADGARQLPLKAPAEHEPAIPANTDHVVVLAGLTALGKTLSAETIHRPEIFSRISGCSLGNIISLEDVAAELLDPRGGLKNIPPGARRTILLNQASSIFDPQSFEPILEKLNAAYDSIIITELNKQELFIARERTAGIILAAGGSERYGSPKQLAVWNGKPLLRWVAESALSSLLTEVIVVTGAFEEKVVELLKDLPGRMIHNPEWSSGQASSINTGLSAISPQVGAALFLLGDQPQVQTGLINELIKNHWQTLAPVTAPDFEGKRGNPVLFDRVTFPALNNLTGDVGGRVIFKDYPPLTIPWNDGSILVDIDQPTDFNKLLKR
jgi:molybdenum cofactor cytidylyltransferase